MTGQPTHSANAGESPSRSSAEVQDQVPRPPFPLVRPTSASWREQALSKMAELRFVRDWMLATMDAKAMPPATRRAIEDTIDEHLRAAADAAKGESILRPGHFVAALTGSGVERVISQLDAVESELLRIAPEDYLRGELPSLLAHVQLHLHPQDPRRIRLEAIADRLVVDPPATAANGEQPAPAGLTACDRCASPLDPIDRQAVISAVGAASDESRWKVARLRSLRNVIAVAAFVLTLAAVGMVVFAFANERALPVCFTPANVVCPTSTSAVSGADRPGSTGQETAAQQVATDDIMRRVASGWDLAVVELVGLIAAAIAAAVSLRNVQGTSNPYSLPVALAVLKLPTGALTALLGLLLMRGNFVPGLSALDSPAQIIAWAIVFGYAQQLLTRFVDIQAQTVLDRAGGDARQLAPQAVLEHHDVHVNRLGGGGLPARA